MNSAVKIYMKACSKCGVEKPQSAFPRNRTRKDGHGSRCKSCDKKIAAQYRAVHLEQTRETVRNWRAKYPERARSSDARYHAAHKQETNLRSMHYYAQNFSAVAAQKSQYKKKNRNKHNQWAATREAAKLQATPAWTNHVAVGEFYALAALKTKSAGAAYHVDHIVPLNSRIVCGLHTHYNLQVILGRTNMSKGNRHWPDMPN